MNDLEQEELIALGKDLVWRLTTRPTKEYLAKQICSESDPQQALQQAKFAIDAFMRHKYHNLSAEKQALYHPFEIRLRKIIMDLERAVFSVQTYSILYL